MPHLEEERVQKLLPWLIQLQDGKATAYLLPFLALATGPDMPEKTRQKWINSAREAQVGSLLAARLMLQHGLKQLVGKILTPRCRKQET